MKNFKSLYGFGERCLKIRDVCMDFEPNFKVRNLISIYPKNIKLGQMTNLNMIFHVVVSVYRLVVKFETHPSSLLNFGTAYSAFAVSFHSTRSDARVRCDSGVIFLDQSEFFAMRTNQ